MKDIEKKKMELAKKGIRDLHHTPGKLITKKGHIDGYLSAFGIPWGKISFTPEQAEKAMGFRSKKGSTGVVISRRRYVDENGKVKSGLFAISLMPRTVPATEKIIPSWERMSVLGKIVSKYKEDIIRSIWEPLVINKSRRPWGGPYYFRSVNIKRIGAGLDWSKLLISEGKVRPPGKVVPVRYDVEKEQIEMIIPQTIEEKPITINQMGIGILDIISGDFFHISPGQITEEVEQRLRVYGMKAKELRIRRCGETKPVELRWEVKQVRKYYKHKGCKFGKWKSRFYIYNYYKRGKHYSASICSRIRVCKSRLEWTSLLGRSGIPMVVRLEISPNGVME